MIVPRSVRALVVLTLRLPTFALAACAADPAETSMENEPGSVGNPGLVGSGGTLGTPATGGGQVTSGAPTGGSSSGGSSSGGSGGIGVAPSQPSKGLCSKQAVGAACTGAYRNLFKELGKGDAEIADKLSRAAAQLMHGNSGTQAIYFENGADQAYIKDIQNNDVRSEGMSYGMMIAVEMGLHTEFDRLWRFAANVMRNANGTRQGYFGWQVRDGAVVDHNPASDGDEYIAMALFFAAGRWGSGQGLLDYGAQANAILHNMLHKDDTPNSEGVTNMFDRSTKQVVFVPVGAAAKYTDPSYHLPAFYDLWAAWSDQDGAFWHDAAAAGRRFWPTVLHPATGLSPKYSHFDGSLTGDGQNFEADSWRVGHNIALDNSWFAADPTGPQLCGRLLAFFRGEGTAYGDHYTISGQSLGGYHSVGLIAMNASAAVALPLETARPFVEELWNLPIPTGNSRYYDGTLYLLGLLHVAGQFRIYAPH